MGKTNHVLFGLTGAWVSVDVFSWAFTPVMFEQEPDKVLGLE